MSVGLSRGKRATPKVKGRARQDGSSNLKGREPGAHKGKESTNLTCGQSMHFLKYNHAGRFLSLLSVAHSQRPDRLDDAEGGFKDNERERREEKEKEQRKAGRGQGQDPSRQSNGEDNF